MTRYLLDTNIVSNLVKPEPSEALIEWMAEQEDEDLFISVFTIAEIERGIREMTEGRRRRQMEDWLNGQDGPQQTFAGRILPFDQDAALIWARLMADGTADGRSRSAIDTMIAAVAIANDCIVVTDNGRDFDGVEYINPIRGQAHYGG